MPLKSTMRYRWFKALCLLAIGLLCSLPGTSLRAQVIDELTLQTGEAVGCGADSTGYYAQSFFADVWKVSRYGVWLRRAVPNGFVRLALAPDRDGAPALDSLLHQSEYINPNDLGQLYVITGLNEYVVKDHKYWVVVDGYQNPATSGYVAVGTSGTFTDSFEPLHTSEDGGLTWQELPATPMSIFVEGDTCVFPVDLFPSLQQVCASQIPFTLDAGTGYAHYDWSTGDTTSSIQLSAPGFITCTVVDAAGCVGQDTIQVVVDPTPDPGLPDTISICQGETALLLANIGFESYLWSDGSMVEFTNATTAGAYTVQVTDFTGCVGHDTTMLLVEMAPTLVLPSDTAFCEGGVMVVTAPPDFTGYLWSTGQTDEAIAVEVAGDYWVDVTTASGCIFRSDTFTLIVHPLPAIPFITAQDSLLLTVNLAGHNYQWTQDGFPVPGADSATYLPQVHGTVSVLVTDGNGCTSESALYLYDWEPDTTGNRMGFVPTGFSPNGDGVNDVFFFPSAESAQGVKLSVVNRWGELVFEADPYQNNWNGQGRGGQELPSGNYYYSIEYHNGEPARQGVVLLNR